jgi:2TM domain
MNDPKSRREYSTGEVEAIVRIALERQGTEGRISHDELLETAREIGVSAEDIEEAVAEEARIREEMAQIEADRQRARRLFVANLVAFVVVNAALFVVDRMTSGGTWFYFPLIAWGVAVAIHAVLLIFTPDPADLTAQIEATRGKSRARIDAAFGESRISARRPRFNRTGPLSPPSEDDDSEAEPRSQRHQQD